MNSPCNNIEPSNRHVFRAPQNFDRIMGLLHDNGQGFSGNPIQNEVVINPRDIVHPPPEGSLQRARKR